ncbi:acetate--CoA ligase family protein [Salinispirillum sp. LH 10-3-1]|uniref:Acetate--CoA ligase family protein n=1 Tax=Salinispirillum sp. LH 10-3-1 TaxID=2952525 RepID=A0AB38YDE4_9GAMM
MADLDAFFQPKSIAVLGASEREGSMGGLVLQNLQGAGYPHRIIAVNLKRYETVYGVKCIYQIRPEDHIDLAVICLPAKALLRAIKSAAEAGVKAALVLSGGMARDQLSTNTMRRMTQLARRWGIRLMGPNSLGVIVPSFNMNVSYSHIQARPGNIAYVGMSSALGSALLDWATGRGYGFSHFVTVGARADVSISDVVDYLAEDRRVKAILLHVENIRNAQRFMTALRAASKSKKVLILKTDMDTPVPEGLANRLKLDQAYFDRAGVLQVDNIQTLLGGVETLVRSRTLYSYRVALLGNGLGPAFLAEQELQRQGGLLAHLDGLPDSIKSQALHQPRTRNNPLILPASVSPELLRDCLDALDKLPDIGAKLVILVPSVRLDVAGVTHELLAHHKRSRRTLMVVWMGEATVGAARQELDDAGVLNFDMPMDAVVAFSTIVQHEKVQAYLRGTPEKTTLALPQQERLEEYAKPIKDDLPTRLSWDDTRALLAEFGFELNGADYRLDRDALTAVPVAAEKPVSLRLLHERYLYPFAYSADPQRRWRGVAIDITSTDQLVQEADRLLDELANHFPDSTFHGFAVQPMRRRLDSLQFSMGITRDQVYGPVLLFGLGGTSANVRSDRNMALPPLNRTLARVMLRETHVYELLQERCRQPVLAEDVLLQAIMRLSAMAEQCPWLEGLEMNLVLERDDRLVVLGSAAQRGLPVSPAIPVYPGEWIKTLRRKQASYTLRPIRAEDEPAMKVLFEQQTPEALRLRFFGSRLNFEHRELAAMCQVDYHREMAMVLEDDQGHLLGEVRGWTRLGKVKNMEFAILLDRTVQKQGLAIDMLAQLESFAHSRDVKLMRAEMLPENHGMRKLGLNSGYQVTHLDDDMVTIEKPLSTTQ